MKDMKEVRLADLLSIEKGKKIMPAEEPTSIRYIQIEDLRGDANLKWAQEDQDVVACNEKDVLLAWDGANAGEFGYGLKGAVGSTLAKLSPLNGSTHTPYVGHFLKSKTPYLRSKCTGATIPHVNRRVLEDIKIPLPPLPEQRRIAAILDKAQALVANDKRTLAVYDQLAKSLFLEKIGDTISNPKGWPLYELQQLCDMRRGASPRPIDDYMGGTVPWIKIGDCTKGSSIYVDSTAEHVTEEGARRSVLLEPGALILANSGVSLGFARITRIRGCVHDGWLALENIKEERIEKLFLLKVLNSITEYLRKKAPEGTQPNLNTAMMKTFRIPVPPLQVQGAFSKTIEAIDAQALNATTSLHRSEALFGSLLQRAFSGALAF